MIVAGDSVTFALPRPTAPRAPAKSPRTPGLIIPAASCAFLFIISNFCCGDNDCVLPTGDFGDCFCVCCTRLVPPLFITCLVWVVSTVNFGLICVTVLAVLGETACVVLTTVVVRFCSTWRGVCGCACLGDGALTGERMVPRTLVDVVARRVGLGNNGRPSAVR